jgi:hypothetical protein
MPPQSASATAPIAVGAFAAGAALALLGKRLLDSRRTADGASAALDTSDDPSSEDLASVLRRAALDVAVLATGQAAERLQNDEAAAGSG